MVAQAVRIREMVQREKARLADENLHLRRALRGAYHLDNVVGKSRAMRAVYEQVALVARSRATVLITGERGTGKEVVAKAIHVNSDRSRGPFVRLSCASLPEGPLAEELFGVASADGAGPRAGRCEQASGGTIFLDEVSALPAALQFKLLRLLQEREVERVGGRTAVAVDVRVVAATNQDLPAEVRAGRFREDLYYRLNVVPIHLPPLRDRGEDVALLAHHFLARFGEENGKQVRGFSPAALDALSRHDWPGNVRELENVVERAVVLSRGPLVGLDELPWRDGAAPVDREEPLEATVARAAEPLFADPPPQGVYRALLDRVERALVERALERSGGVRLKAARLLGINRNTLYAKLDGPVQR